MKYKNLVFLGTSHIARQSLNEVKQSIEREMPGIIALELDAKRLPALMGKSHWKIGIRAIRHIGLKGYLFSLLGAWAERKLGKLVGVAPGSEMKQAVRIAKDRKIKLALIDQDIEITLRRLSKSITWREKWNFIADVMKALFSGKKGPDFDLSTVPDKEIIRKLAKRLKERYPNVYKALIDERNAVIAQNLKKLADSSPDEKILVILGAGHIDDVMALVKEPKVSYSFSAG